MKNTILAIMIGALLLPSVSFASEKQDQYRLQLIALLWAQIEILQNMLDEKLEAQNIGSADAEEVSEPVEEKTFEQKCVDLRLETKEEMQAKYGDQWRNAPMKVDGKKCPALDPEEG